LAKVEQKTENLAGDILLFEGTPVLDADNKTITAILIKSGVSKRKNYYTPECLESAAPLFVNKKMYFDHPVPGSPEATGKAARSFRDWVGTIIESYYVPEEKGIGAKIGIRDNGLWEKVSEAHKHGWLNEIGLSINAMGKTRIGRIGDEQVHVVETIVKPHSVDFVPDASAGGHIQVVHESDVEISDFMEEKGMTTKITLKDLVESNPEIVAEIEKGMREQTLEEAAAAIDTMAEHTKSLIDEFVDLVESETAEVYTDVTEAAAKEEAPEGVEHLEEVDMSEFAKVLGERDEQINLLAEAATQAQDDNKEMGKRIEELEEKLIAVTSKAVADKKLQESGLPIGMKKRLMQSLIGADPDDMDTIIQESKALYAEIQEETTTKGAVRGLGDGNKGDDKTSKQTQLDKLFGVLDK
jgi:hypothetical protein